jgi:toluene monooxygenase system protein E
MKTYSRLQSGRRRPSEYEIVSTDLQYTYPSRFELAPATPVIHWYERYREGSGLSVRDWSPFSDPRNTTYRSYTTLQHEKEQAVQGLLDEIDESRYDQRLAEPWIRFLDTHYFPLRFPLHGLEMLAAYIGQMAPSSRLTNCATFQAGDEMRRMQRIAYRTAQLCRSRAGIDPSEHRATWEEAEHFQPLRELIERALVCYDWGEALILTNVVIKSRLDHWINEQLAGALAPANGDPILRSIHFSLGQDSQWHKEWTAEATRLAIADEPNNEDVIQEWIDTWTPLADAAHSSLARAAVEADGVVPAQSLPRREDVEADQTSGA